MSGLGLLTAARQESQGSAGTEGLFQTFLNSEHPQNEKPGYQFWERKRIKAAEGKLRVFWQMEEDVLPARPNTGCPTQLLPCSALEHPLHQAGPAQDQRRLGWAVLGRAAASSWVAKILVQHHRVCPSSEPLPVPPEPSCTSGNVGLGLDVTPLSLAWCCSTSLCTEKGPQWHLSGHDIPAAVPSPHTEAVAGPTWMLHRQGWRDFVVLTFHSSTGAKRWSPTCQSKPTVPSISCSTALTNLLRAWQKGLIPRNLAGLGGDSHTYGTGKAPSIQHSWLQKREGTTPPGRYESSVSPL